MLRLSRQADVPNHRECENTVRVVRAILSTRVPNPREYQNTVMIFFQRWGFDTTYRGYLITVTLVLQTQRSAKPTQYICFKRHKAPHLTLTNKVYVAASVGQNDYRNPSRMRRGLINLIRYHLRMRPYNPG